MAKKKAQKNVAASHPLDWDKIDPLMFDRGISQKTLHDLGVIKTDTFRRMRNGDYSATTLSKLAAALDLNPEDLPRIEVTHAKTTLAAATRSEAQTVQTAVTVSHSPFATSRILRHATANLFGRQMELDVLDAVWAEKGINVFTLIAWGGVGKTALVANWIQNRMPADVERYFDWSFYSQGTDESRQTSPDFFIREALEYFGDPDPVKGSARQRGERLADLVRKQRTLLVLDGIEPLQYPPTDKSGQGGRLKDDGLMALLTSLARANPGLCVVTTRVPLTDLDGYAALKKKKLGKLMLEAAIALIRHLQLVGTQAEIKAMWEMLGGHALTILQLGRLLARGYGHEMQRWREIGFRKTDKLKQGRSISRLMRKYEDWLQSGEPGHQLELAALRLTGLFDRPMDPGCFRELRKAPVIDGLTNAFEGADDVEIEAAITTLVENDLVTHGCEPSETPKLHLIQPIDSHPMIREYFAMQLKKKNEAGFKAAHSRLFDYLCETTKPHQPDSLEGLQPLYQAVVHGCQAGRHQEACDKVYTDRILRGTGNDGFYISRKLGAIGADLAAVAAFFDEPWNRVSPNLREGDQAWLLNTAAVYLGALGRLTEAVQPMRAGVENYVRQEEWKFSAITASNLSELEVTLGRLAVAVTDGRESITHADRSRDAFWRMASRSKAADALHQSGQRSEAGTLFDDAERMQKERQAQFQLLYSLRGFQYCDWLLAPTERTAWQSVLRGTGVSSVANDHAATCNEVERRATTTLGWAKQYLHLLDNALDHLTLVRVELIRAILNHSLPQPMLDLPHVAAAVDGLRAAGDMTYLPLGLLTAALYHFVRGEHDLARQYLAECQQIAERGPMPLHLADVHLHRAQLFKNKDELTKAAKLIRDLGYGRRNEELADAEEAAKNW